MSKINYGFMPLKKNERRASMKEAVDAGQVRYWGLYKVDSRLLEARTQSKQSKKSNLMEEYSSLKGKFARKKREYEAAKDPDKKEQLYADLKVLADKVNELARAINKGKPAPAPKTEPQKAPAKPTELVSKALTKSMQSKP